MGPRARKIVNYTWAGQAFSATTIPLNSKLLMGTFVLDTSFDETVTRVRGLISITSDASIVVEQQIGAWGMIVVSDEAVAIGVTAIPSPVFDAANDGWFVWVPFAQQSSFSTGAGFQGGLYHVDSKAQRIVQEGSQIAVVVENSSAVHGLSIMQNIRLLARFRS